MFFFNQKTSYEMRISDWSSDVCSSDLRTTPLPVSSFYEPGETPPNLGTLDRLYVLISSNTASASEMIINGLKPFMKVILVGDDVTIGKNVASITIVDNSMPEDKRIPYGLQPIVYKIYNDSMKSDFEMGYEYGRALCRERVCK